MNRHGRWCWPFIALLFGACGRDAPHVPARAESAVTSAPRAWLDTADRLDPADSCAAAVRRQLAILRDDTLSERLRFGDFAVTGTAPPHPAALDVNSLRSAREFRTKLREALDTAGVNFAGHYSVVAVGMTGWGFNYWIVDRITGFAYEFPYKAVYLDFSRESDLVVMDSKPRIMKALREMSDMQESCAHMGSRRHSELRPFYFRWRQGRLERLGPKDVQPPVNEFWKDYFRQS